ncbi:MAG: ATP-binding protein [bacterium]
MNRKDILKTIISDGQTTPLPKVWRRQLELPIDSEKIVTLTGVRRSGKTYHLFGTMEQLVESGVDSTKLLYINFEDERLRLSGEEMDEILQAYRELYPDTNLSDVYFFFDEIQEVDGWEKFVDRLYSSITKHIFITGSNSKFLSKEIATSLRGRTITYEVYPLSFSELASITYPDVDPNSSRGKAQLANLYDKYLIRGGFPEVIKSDDSIKDKILQEYFNVMLLHDLVERYNISQSVILKYFCKRVVATTASEFSVNKIYNELKSQGYHISKDTLYSYVDNIESIYLARFVPKYSESFVKSENSQKKVYIIDQGMGASLDFKLAGDKGRLLETTVALELLKQGSQIAYSQDETSECDFVKINKEQVIEAIQVTYDISDKKTLEREINGLVRCCKRFGLSEGYILTIGADETNKVDGIDVHILSAWKYSY